MTIPPGSNTHLPALLGTCGPENYGGADHLHQSPHGTGTAESEIRSRRNCPGSAHLNKDSRTRRPKIFRLPQTTRAIPPQSDHTAAAAKKHFTGNGHLSLRGKNLPRQTSGKTGMNEIFRHAVPPEKRAFPPSSELLQERGDQRRSQTDQGNEGERPSERRRMGNMPDDRRSQQKAQKADRGNGGQSHAGNHLFGLSGHAVAEGDNGRGAQPHQKEAQRGRTTAPGTERQPEARRQSGCRWHAARARLRSASPCGPP